MSGSYVRPDAAKTRVEDPGAPRVLRAAGQVLDLQDPADAPVRRALSPPSERVLGAIPERPADLRALVVGAELDDVRPLRPAELPPVDLPHRVAPEDVPGVEARVVDAERAPVEL